MPQILTKDAFKRLSAAGKLGNTFQQWETLDELTASGYQGFVTVRARKGWGMGLFIPLVAAGDLYGVYDTLCVRVPVHHIHGPLDAVYFQECPGPETERVINLEAARGPNGAGGLYVRYALNDPLNLRHSLERNGVDAEGLRALMVLQRYVPAQDLDTLNDIWDQYPDAIIEASVFTRGVGVRGQKTVVWECRNY